MTTTQKTEMLRTEIPAAREALLKANLAGDTTMAKFWTGYLAGAYKQCEEMGIDELTLEPVAA
jgi:hypothetical protein